MISQKKLLRFLLYLQTSHRRLTLLPYHLIMQRGATFLPSRHPDGAIPPPPKHNFSPQCHLKDFRLILVSLLEPMALVDHQQDMIIERLR